MQEISDGLEAPGFSVKKSIEQARMSGSYGQGGPGGDSLRNFDNRQANFSVEEPTILSDTLGVDFGSWLRLVYYRVRDNWYAVIPELIRSGTKGKVVIIFDIHSNGRIENLQVVRSSGLSPYDRAAVSSLKLSEPFPVFRMHSKASCSRFSFPTCTTVGCDWRPPKAQRLYSTFPPPGNPASSWLPPNSN